MKGKTIYNYNFKGGTGKSSLTVIEAYLLAKSSKKVLLIDLDPQANATDMLNVTYKTDAKPTTQLVDGLTNGNLKNSIVSLDDYLDIMPSDWSMSLFEQRIDKLDVKTKSTILATLLQPIKNDYDYIFVDTPPSMSPITNNALLASDYVTVVVQTQRASYRSAIQTVAYYTQMKDDFSAHYDFIGAMLYLFAGSGAIDRKIEKDAKEFFGEALFANKVYHRERVKRWAQSGIKIDGTDAWDKRTTDMYRLILNEMLYRMGDKTNV